jgi:A/G-specific adenine glycosylase
MPARESPVAARLLRWFGAHRRDLPWRREPRTAYRVWVSEIMLQQTQVKTVVPYYLRWLRRFPDVRRLAAASIDEVLKAWEGLGYYRRARKMHEAAALVMRRRGGKFPSSASELGSLPGIGPYTAAAVASIAFGEDVVAVDGNVRRVTSRLMALGDPTPEAVRTRLEALLPAGRAGAFNEAMMEIGAGVCLPRRPLCPSCPLSSACRAHRSGRVGRFPPPPRRRRVPRVQVVAIVAVRGNAFLLMRRPECEMLGGLWGFPIVREGTLTGIEGILLPPVRHDYTHLSLTALPLLPGKGRGELVRSARAEGAKFISRGEISKLALSRLDHKILARVEAAPKRHLKKSRGRLQ